MAERSETLARATRLRAMFEARGAIVVEPPILQSAETLLDLYGEDIRARAYVTSDGLRGEQMLRPDFTVPVVEMHMSVGAEPARYTYSGEVFRRQEYDQNRANEYVQVGYEIFDGSNPASADAEVFQMIASALAGLPVQPVTGDIGILMAAVNGLQTTQRRKDALMRHIWRPRRFRVLLDRYAGRTDEPQTRLALLAGKSTDQAPLIGLRSQAEIDERVAALHDDAQTPPIATTEVELIQSLLTVRETIPNALSQLYDLQVDLPSISAAVTGIEKRAEAMDKRGVNTDKLMFEASYGRVSMEYYDGFVFGFRATDTPNLPAIATGGRYDALTKRLGRGREIPAVGGVLRPGLMLELEATK